MRVLDTSIRPLKRRRTGTLIAGPSSRIAHRGFVDQIRLGIGAIAVVGLHIVDDSFLHPERGTTARGHLASGLIPLALLVFGAIAFRRGRAGVRATIALVVGSLGTIVGATSGVYEALTVGPSG